MGRRTLLVSIASLLILGLGSRATAQEPAPDKLPTPPRLSLVDGPTSFWRPGAEDWAPAQANTPLAAGDFVYTGSGGNVEVQIGTRAFIRAGEGTQLQLAGVEPDYVQVKISAGQASLDLREFSPGHTVEVDTPNAAFTIERGGYYRFDIGPQSTALITRRGGAATLTPANGRAVPVSASEEVIIGAGDATAIYAAPEPDVWDTWNYRRTEYLVDSMSARYVAPGVYGAADLDHNGTWRSVPDYGPVWIPGNVPTGWAPYSVGHWVYDPVFGWTWVDNASWGWAPFHYGRWVSVNGYWAWAPGPVVLRPVYSPALVGWLSGGAPGVGVGVGWVALGWGEPIVPWWGPREFVGRPYWGGWGGPRVVNRTVINNVTNVNVTNITYVNTQVHNAVVGTSADRFGRGGQSYTHISAEEVGRWHPAQHGIEVKPTAASLVSGEGRAARPPREIIDRSVVAKREPSREPFAALRKAGINPTERPGAQSRPVAPTIVAKPEASARPAAPARALEPRNRPLQTEVIERQPSAPPPTFNSLREQRPSTGPRVEPELRRPAPPPASAPRPAPSFAERRNLPGVPAMQLRPPTVHPPAQAQSVQHPPAPPGPQGREREQRRQ